MTKLESLLRSELDEIKQSLSDEKATKESAESTLKAANEKIEQLNKAFYKVAAQIEAIEEDAKANKVAAVGFLKGLTNDEDKLNFAALCETFGIEIEIEADENAETDEEAEEGGTLLSTGT